MDSRAASWIWPGSHAATRRLFDAEPQIRQVRSAPGSTSAGDALFERAGLKGQPPLEFVGAAGLVLFWDAWLFHSGSRNTRRDTLRVAAFAKWHESTQDESPRL